MNKYSSYRSEMVRTDGRTDTEGYNIIPRHTLVAGYKKSAEQTKSVVNIVKIFTKMHQYIKIVKH